MDYIIEKIDQDIAATNKLFLRKCVRGIILKDDRILLMYSSRDNMYGTPGGVIMMNETKYDALHRELLEEVGAFEINILKNIGSTYELRKSRSYNGEPIRIESDYYLIDVLTFTDNALESHEEDMGLIPLWVKIDEAIRHNQKQLANYKAYGNISFYHTQTDILSFIKEHLIEV